MAEIWYNHSDCKPLSTSFELTSWHSLVQSSDKGTGDDVLIRGCGLGDALVLPWRCIHTEAG